MLSCKACWWLTLRQLNTVCDTTDTSVHSASLVIAMRQSVSKCFTTTEWLMRKIKKNSSQNGLATKMSKLNACSVQLETTILNYWECWLTTSRSVHQLLMRGAGLSCTRLLVGATIWWFTCWLRWALLSIAEKQKILLLYIWLSNSNRIRL